MGFRHLVLYDGECGLCDRSVQWLLRHDRRGALHFAPLQGETARRFVERTSNFETMVLVEPIEGGGARVFERSRAVFGMLRELPAPWRWLAILRVLPTALTDAVYRFVAARRLRWFGRADACRLPVPEEAARFLP